MNPKRCLSASLCLVLTCGSAVTPVFSQSFKAPSRVSGKSGGPVLGRISPVSRAGSLSITLPVMGGRSGILLPLSGSPKADHIITSVIPDLPGQPLAGIIPVDAALPVITPAGKTAAPTAKDDLGAIAQRLTSVSPDNAGSISPEEAGHIASEVFDLSGPAKKGSVSYTDPTGNGSGGSGNRSLNKAAGDAAPRTPAATPAPSVKESLRVTLADRAHHARLWLENIYWYTVTHIRNMWPRQRAQIEEAQREGIDLPVSKHRRFFSWMRGMGQNGAFYVMGWATMDEDTVVEEAQWTYDKFFDSPRLGPKQRLAFDEFLVRARDYNAEKRAPSHFKKVVRDGLLKAATKPVSELVAHFDALARPRSAVKVEKFQERHQDDVIAAFREAIVDTIAEEPWNDPSRIIGVVVLGSFARGGAHSRSDFDTQFVTANGRQSRVLSFKARLLARWIEMGRHQFNPLGVMEFPSSPSKGVLMMTHHDPYFIVAGDKDLEETLAWGLPDKPLFDLQQEMKLRHRIARWLHVLTVYVATYLGDLDEFRKPTSKE